MNTEDLTYLLIFAMQWLQDTAPALIGLLDALTPILAIALVYVVVRNKTEAKRLRPVPGILSHQNPY